MANFEKPASIHLKANHSTTNPIRSANSVIPCPQIPYFEGFVFHEVTHQIEDGAVEHFKEWKLKQLTVCISV